LFSKILRTTDAQALEAHNVSDEENMQGKGRSMVSDLIQIPTSVVPVENDLFSIPTCKSVMSRQLFSFLLRSNPHRTYLP
jgi:hypothetical protein